MSPFLLHQWSSSPSNDEPVKEKATTFFQETSKDKMNIIIYCYIIDNSF